MKYIVVCSLLVCAGALRTNDGDPGVHPKYTCVVNSSTSNDLTDYARLFQKWSGQTVMIVGDSLALQLFNVIRCGARSMSWKHDIEETTYYYNSQELNNGFTTRPVAEKHFPVEQITSETMFPGLGASKDDIVQGVLTKSSIRPHGESSTRENREVAVTLYMYFHFMVKLDAQNDSRVSARLAPSFSDEYHPKGFFNTKPAALIDVLSSVPVDHIFTNLGHHALKFQSQLELDIDPLFRIFNAGILAAEGRNFHKRPTLTVLSHPPQHYNNPTGDYVLGGTNRTQPCSNDVPDIRNQLVMKNNRLKRQKAVEYGLGFASIDFSESMIPYGNMHFPQFGDCTHYALSPVAWAGAIKSIANA